MLILSTWLTLLQYFTTLKVLNESKFEFNRVDKEAKSINYAVTVDVNIDFDVVSEYVETKKKYSGTFTASGSKSARSYSVFKILSVIIKFMSNE